MLENIEEEKKALVVVAKFWGKSLIFYKEETNGAIGEYEGVPIYITKIGE